MPTTDRKLRVFLCHASQDKPAVRELYQKLLAEGWIDPWLDEEKLLPGQAWDLEIEKAVETTEAVIVCLSNNSVTKEGYVQKEFRKIVETALEKPEETIFIIPLRLDACELPRQLRDRQAVDYFPPERRTQNFQRLLKSLEIRFHQLGSPKDGLQIAAPEVKMPILAGAEEKPHAKEMSKRLVDLLVSKGTGTVDITGSIPMSLYFLLAANYILTPSDSTNQLWAGIFGILASIPLVIRKQLPATIFFRISAITYLVIYTLNFNNQTPLVKTSEGMAALILCGLCIVTVRAPKKPVFYASLALALFLFLVGIKEIMSSFAYYPDFISMPALITIASLGTVILLLGDL